MKVVISYIGHRRHEDNCTCGVCNPAHFLFGYRVSAREQGYSTIPPMIIPPGTILSEMWGKFEPDVHAAAQTWAEDHGHTIIVYPCDVCLDTGHRYLVVAPPIEIGHIPENWHRVVACPVCKHFKTDQDAALSTGFRVFKIADYTFIDTTPTASVADPDDFGSDSTAIDRDSVPEWHPDNPFNPLHN